MRQVVKECILFSVAVDCVAVVLYAVGDQQVARAQRAVVMGDLVKGVL